MLICSIGILNIFSINFSHLCLRGSIKNIKCENSITAFKILKCGILMHCLAVMNNKLFTIAFPEKILLLAHYLLIWFLMDFNHSIVKTAIIIWKYDAYFSHGATREGINWSSILHYLSKNPKYNKYILCTVLYSILYSHIPCIQKSAILI